MVDMIGMTLRSMGLDPDVLLGQIRAIGEAFEKLSLKLDRIEANQRAIMTHMGLYVEPDAETLALIEAESEAHVRVNGGATAPGAP